ncbi:LysR family transcriptional regulator [Microaerobacter geothermalis]|uniref:LysR family transcriptional regulator n=1 Tax=Microaerobacter geothermalis TaxID=674972 RepID=UPI001F1D2259|nr:LysR family transcriptional regulator [Microaerobacter geothermalis]MCF6094380.1 LysR family transcriptional regulator [Microaerobacter geothermalis]
MTLRHLRIFIEVCDSGGMTAAAEKMYMTQPSISQAIAELEGHYNVKLFERLGRKLYITAAGNRLLSYARHIINLYERVEREVRVISENGILRVGASVTVGTCILSEVVKTFVNRCSNVEVTTTVDNTKVIEEMILSDKIDIGLVEGFIHSPDIIEEPFYDDELVLICHPKHPWAVKGYIEAEELSGCPLIIREKGSGTRELFEAEMAVAGLKWRTVGVYNNAEAIKNAVAADMGVAVISRLAVEREVQMGDIKIVDIKGLQFMRKFNLIYHKNKYFSNAMREIRDMCLHGGIKRK